MTALILREPTLDDHDAWLALFQGYNAFYGRSGPTALAPEIIGATWSRIHDDNEPVHALVAEKDEKLVGFTHFIFHRTTISIALTCYLQDLFTVPEARGQGVARALIEAVYARAREAGSARVYWLTHESNATARRLYDQVAENSGFLVYRKPLG